MYKKLSLDGMMTLQTSLFQRLRTLCQQQRHQYLKGFLQEMVNDSERVYFLRDNKPVFGFFPQPDGGLRLIDETEYIELCLSCDEVERLHNILKDQQTINASQKHHTAFQELLTLFYAGNLRHISEKPFLVYDIETTMDPRTGAQKFAIAYLLDTNKDHTNQLDYEFVDTDQLGDFAQRLVDYDGRIIGFNHISFDNPVVMRQSGLSPHLLDVVQKKSLDPFQLVRRLTGRRMSLNSMATALLGLGKTLSSGIEGQQLLDKRFASQDQKAFHKVKEYCKNDVEITLGVFLYMLHYKDLNLDGQHYRIDEQKFFSYGSVGQEEQVTSDQQGLFG